MNKFFLGLLLLGLYPITSFSQGVELDCPSGDLRAIFPGSVTINPTTGAQRFNFCIVASNGHMFYQGDGSGAGGVTSVTASKGITSSGGTTPNITLGGVIPEANPAVLNPTGSFLGSANSFYLESTPGGCNPADAITAWNTIFNPNATFTDAITGCVNFPAGSGVVTNAQGNGISGYFINNNSSQQNQFGLGNANGSAVNGIGYCKANNTECEGLVAEMVDTAGLTNVTMVGSEVGAFPHNTGDVVFGFLVSPFGNTQVSGDNFLAFAIHQGGAGTALATSGFKCFASSMVTRVGGTYSTCVELNIAGSNNNSQAIVFNSTGPLSGDLLQSNDNGGGSAKPRLIYTPESGSGAGSSFTVGALIMATQSSQVSGCSVSGIGGGAAGKFTSGVSGTCTVTITLGVTTFGGWACSAHDLTTPADVINQTAFTNTTATLSGTTVSGDLITYNCVGF